MSEAKKIIIVFIIIKGQARFFSVVTPEFYVKGENTGHNSGIDTHSGVSARVLQLGIEGSVGVEPKLERVTSRINAAQKNAVWKCKFCGWRWHFLGKVHAYEAILGSHQFASIEAVGSVASVAVSFVQGLVKQHSQPMLWLRSEQGGPTTVAGSCDKSCRNGDRHGTCSGTLPTQGSPAGEGWPHVCDSSQKKGLCTTR